MTTRNLDALFAPRTLALIGASATPGTIGNIVARNMLAGGFSGPVMFVNPTAAEVCGKTCYPSAAALPEPPDLAVIATPPRTIPEIVGELGRTGCRAVVIITAGLTPTEKQAMLDAARPHLLRIVGPNCLGFLSPARGINCSFSHMAPLKGRLALLSQSGAIATSIIDWANGNGIGFSHLVSMGDMADVDFGDLLDFLAMDADTSAILLYAESVTAARKFMSAGRIAARAKPVIVVKAGRSTAGARAAASHTGALAGADAVYDAAFRRAGMLRVDTLRDLFDAAATLDSGVRIYGDNLAILTNGGGLGVLATDAFESLGGKLARLSDDTIAALDRVLPKAWSRGNPVDVIGDANGERYAAALQALSADAAADAVLIMNCPTGVSDNLDAAKAVIGARAQNPKKPMLGCWMGAASTDAPRRLLAEAGLPNYQTPDEAVRAFHYLREYDRNQKALYETPIRDVAGDRQDGQRTVKDIIEGALAENRSILTEPEAKAALAAYGIPVVQTAIAPTPAEAEAAATRIGSTVALKILSRQITHKSDVGGVHLDLESPQAVRQAAEDMLARVRKQRPDAVIDGFTVQEMVKRPHAQELLLGAVVDSTFGPCLLFGHGGVATEIIADRTVALPPLNSVLARDMIDRPRVSRLLAGYRDRAPADLDAITAALVALSQMVIDHPTIWELDINPLLADHDGVIALDARIVVRAGTKIADRLAIRPWPRELVRDTRINGRSIELRPIRPGDAASLMQFASRTRASDLRMRFHGAVSQISETTATRLCQIDYDREMVLVAQEADAAFSGVVRLVFDPDFEAAEMAIIVRSDVQRQGLGQMLLEEALRYARLRGAKRVFGEVLSDNVATLQLARKVGGQLRRAPEDATVTRVELQLK